MLGEQELDERLGDEQLVQRGPVLVVLGAQPAAELRASSRRDGVDAPGRPARPGRSVLVTRPSVSSLASSGEIAAVVDELLSRQSRGETVLERVRVIGPINEQTKQHVSESHT